MKKLLAIILALMLVLSVSVVLVACDDVGSTTPVNFEVPEGGYDGQPITITFYSTMGQDYVKVLDRYIEEFNVLYPNITVEHNHTIGGYDEVRNQIRTELGNGQSPNLAYCYPDHVALYNRSRSVIHLDNLLSSKEVVTRADGTTETLGLTDAQKADFIEGYYNEGNAFGDGHQYLLPFSKSTEVMFYNVDFFEDNHLDVPDHWFASDGKEGTATSDKTSMEYVLAKIKEIDPLCTPLGYDSESNWFITLCEQFGTPYTSATGEHFLFDTAENRAMVKTLNRWYQSRWITTKAMLNGSYCSSYFVSTDSSEGKRSYLCVGSSAGASHQLPAMDADGNYLFEVGITTIPQADKNNPKVISQGPSICIFKKENPQEVIASYLLLKFLTTNAEFQAEFAKVGGYTPVIKSANELPWYKKLLDEGNGGAKISGLSARICVEQTDAYFASPVFFGSSAARDEVGKILTACFIMQGDNIDSQIKKEFERAIGQCEYVAG